MAIEIFNDKVINKKAIDELSKEEADELMEILSRAGY
jgi:hypothetical protein